MTDEIKIGPLTFTRDGSINMSVETENEVAGYCDNVYDDVWEEFVAAVEAMQAALKQKEERPIVSFLDSYGNVIASRPALASKVGWGGDIPARAEFVGLTWKTPEPVKEATSPTEEDVTWQELREGDIISLMVFDHQEGLQRERRIVVRVEGEKLTLSDQGREYDWEPSKDGLLETKRFLKRVIL
jgi:hypothetical protein